MKGLCQKLEWSLYKLALNAPLCYHSKTTIMTVMIYRPLIGAYKNLLGGVVMLHQPPHLLPNTHLRHKLHVTSRQPGYSDREQDRHTRVWHPGFQWNYCRIKLVKWEERKSESAQLVIVTSLARHRGPCKPRGASELFKELQHLIQTNRLCNYLWLLRNSDPTFFRVTFYILCSKHSVSLLRMNHHIFWI